jgi:hypothetical protein
MIARSRTLTILAVLTAFPMLTGAPLGPATIAWAGDVARVRIDALPTSGNSILFTFENGGPTLRLPKALFASTEIPADPSLPIKGESVGMTFWYPDMTLSDWTSSAGKYFEKQRGVPRRVRCAIGAMEIA